MGRSLQIPNHSQILLLVKKGDSSIATTTDAARDTKTNSVSLDISKQCTRKSYDFRVSTARESSLRRFTKSNMNTCTQEKSLTSVSNHVAVKVSGRSLAIIGHMQNENIHKDLDSGHQNKVTLLFEDCDSEIFKTSEDDTPKNETQVQQKSPNLNLMFFNDTL